MNSCRRWNPRMYVRAALAGLFVWSLAGRAAGIFDVRIGSEFSRVVDTNTAVLTTNATVNLLLEGPTWIPGNPGHLIFSCFNNSNPGDSNGRLKKLVLPNTVTDYLVPPAGTVYNGSTLDMQERFISCQAGTNGLRVVMVTNDSVVTTLVSTCGGLKFYSPNDVAVKSDGTIWFTDPGFNGNTSTPPQAGYQTGHWVYRFDPSNGNATCTAVITNSTITRPNGLCFSPDESLFYLADWQGQCIRVYSVSPGNTLSGGSIFASIPVGNPDGLRCDSEGRVYSSSGDGIYVYMPYPDGRLIGRIISPKSVANLCFGGADRRTLFITAQPYVLSIPLKVTGAVWTKKLHVALMDDATVKVAWPWPSTGFQLQSRPFLDDGGTWTSVSNFPPSVSDGLNMVSLPSTNPAAFFRLSLPSP
jgi:gluconolactonase